jgi:hypothetical protein
MAEKITTLETSLEDELAAFSGHALAGGALTEAACNMAGFVELLARIDSPKERGGENACDGGGYHVRKAKRRVGRIRERRPRRSDLS